MSRDAATIEEFLAVLRKSGLVEAGRLEEAAAPWKGTTGPLPDAVPEAFKKAGLLTDWQIRQLRKGKHRGYFLGQYKLQQELGKGGMSSVYLAEHTGVKMPVALKILPIKRVDEKSYLERFKREAQASFRLNHPNIARATNFDHSGDIWYIVLDYIEGIDLQKKVKEGGVLPVREAVDYIRQAALGLQHAHEEGLVHRDIKPANLILDTRGTIKILDLGLALGSDTDDDEEGGLTKQHDEKVLGTADYLSPEQSRNSHAADPRSDIYSLGCTLYYLLVGRAPFAKGSVVERIKAHWNEPAPNPIDELEVPPPDLDSAIVDLYFRMLEKHPDARPQSAGEVAEAIAAWLEQHAGEGPRPAGSLRRRPGDSAAGGTSLLQSGRRRPASSSSSGGETTGRREPGDRDAARRTPGPAAKPAVARPIDDDDAEPLETVLLDEPVEDKPPPADRQPSRSARPPAIEDEEEDDEEDDEDDDFLAGSAASGKASPRPAAGAAVDDDEDDDFLYGGGAGTAAASRPGAAADDDDDDDDFLGMTQTRGGSQPAAGEQGAASAPAVEDITIAEWWDTTFLRLSVRTWMWIGVGLVIVFLLSIATNETLKSMKSGRWGLYAEEKPAAAEESAPSSTAPAKKPSPSGK